MAKFKSYNYNQTALVAVDLAKQLPPGSLEFAIHYPVDHEIDISCLESRFRNDSKGRPAHNPRILLKIILRSMPGSQYNCSLCEFHAGRDCQNF